MKSVYINLDHFGRQTLEEISFGFTNYTLVWNVPILSAFSIVHGEIITNQNNEMGYKQLLLGESFTISDTNIHLGSGGYLPFDQSAKLVLHCRAIQDYSALFPQIKSDELKTLLGECYREAELALEREMWLSAVLMIGSIYEGLLGAITGNINATLDKIAKKSLEGEIINKEQFAVVTDSRILRNLVHPKQRLKKECTRKDAFAQSVNLDNLIQHLSTAQAKI